MGAFPSSKRGCNQVGGSCVCAAETTVDSGSAMAEYRLYCLDGANKVASAEWIEADDDAAAIEATKKAHAGRECELWQGKRFVARLDLRLHA